MNPRKNIIQFKNMYYRAVRSLVLTIATAIAIRIRTVAPATKLKIKLDKDGVI
jgi:hypothetical protein